VIQFSAEKREKRLRVARSGRKKVTIENDSKSVGGTRGEKRSTRLNARSKQLKRGDQQKTAP